MRGIVDVRFAQVYAESKESYSQNRDRRHAEEDERIGLIERLPLRSDAVKGHAHAVHVCLGSSKLRRDPAMAQPSSGGLRIALASGSAASLTTA